MTDFKKDDDSELHLSTLSPLKPAPSINSIEDLRKFLVQKLDESDKTDKDQHKRLRKTERLLFGFTDEANRQHQGLLQRVEDLEDKRVKALEDKIKQYEEFRTRLLYMAGAITTAGSVLLPFVWAFVKMLLAKAGMKL